MPIDVLYRPAWVAHCVQQWAVSRTLSNVPYGELLRTLASLPPETFHGVAIGLDEERQALLFLSQSKVCGVHLSAGDLRGHDALSHIAHICENLTWAFHQAPDQFAGLVPIMASLVGEGGKQLLRKVGPTMSAHLEAISDLERIPTAFLLAEPAESPELEWVVFSTGLARIHRLVVGADIVELPTVEGLDAGTLMAVCRRQKTTDELYQATPRFYSEEMLASLTSPAAFALAPPQPRQPPSPEPSRRSSVLLYLLPVLVVGLVWGAWMLWKGGSPPSSSAPTPAEAPAQLESELASSRDEVRKLQEEIALLRSQMQTLRPVASPSAPTATTKTRRRVAAPLDSASALSAQTNTRLDSLVKRITYLESAIRRAEESQPPTPAAGQGEAQTTAATPASPSAQRPPSTAQGGQEQPEPPTQEASAPGTSAVSPQATPQESAPSVAVRARAYTETLVDVPPEVLENPPPVYPSFARSRRIQGQVLLSVLVGKDGKVEQAVALRGREELRQAAVDGVKPWRFKPAKLNGVPVACWKTVLISFRAD